MQSIVSYPERGDYGKSSYRGNCSGKLIEDLPVDDHAKPSPQASNVTVEDGRYICPECGHEFVQGQWDYSYDWNVLEFECPDCGWTGNDTGAYDDNNEENQK